MPASSLGKRERRLSSYGLTFFLRDNNIKTQIVFNNPLEAVSQSLNFLDRAARGYAQLTKGVPGAGRFSLISARV